MADPPPALEQLAQERGWNKRFARVLLSVEDRDYPLTSLYWQGEPGKRMVWKSNLFDGDSVCAVPTWDLVKRAAQECLQGVYRFCS